MPCLEALWLQVEGFNYLAIANLQNKFSNPSLPNPKQYADGAKGTANT